jgi:exodeoxyribonuclease-3
MPAKRPFSIVTWNVNGIRAVHKKGALTWLFAQAPDVICLQEVKATKEQIPTEIHPVTGYEAHFVSPTLKKGYSGVAIYTKRKPISVQYGLGIEEFDTEGRLIQMEFENTYLLNIYFPNGGGGPARLKYKLDFYDAFLAHVQKLKKKKHIVFCGDVNTAHTEIDLARPTQNEENTGFLPVERAWIDEVISSGFVDVFRELNPLAVGAYTYWDQKSAARVRNVGWRIDYFFCDKAFMPNVKDCVILDGVVGSDHCPVELILKDCEF